MAHTCRIVFLLVAIAFAVYSLCFGEYKSCMRQRRVRTIYKRDAPDNPTVTVFSSLARFMQRIYSHVMVKYVGVAPEALKRRPLVVTNKTWRSMLGEEWMLAFVDNKTKSDRAFIELWNGISEFAYTYPVLFGVVSATDLDLITRFNVIEVPTILHIHEGLVYHYVNSKTKPSIMTYIKYRHWMKGKPCRPDTLYTSTALFVSKYKVKLRQFLTKCRPHFMTFMMVITCLLLRCMLKLTGNRKKCESGTQTTTSTTRPEFTSRPSQPDDASTFKPNIAAQFSRINFMSRSAAQPRQRTRTPTESYRQEVLSVLRTMLRETNPMPSLDDRWIKKSIKEPHATRSEMCRGLRQYLENLYYYDYDRQFRNLDI